MKKIISPALIFAGALFVLNVQRPPVADKALITAPQQVLTVKGDKYKVDVATSTVEWTGTKPSGSHNGTIKISEGSIEVKKDKPQSGNFTLDMATINDTDLEGRGKEGLEKHLKGADFFDVEKNPTATFEITGFAPIGEKQNVMLEGANYNVSGNLSLKGVSKNVTFPAAIWVKDKVLTAAADFNIDRTEWGMNYGADGKIAKEIKLKLNITANKD